MLKLFKNFRRQECLLVLLALVFIVTQVWLDLTMPEYMAEITRLVQTSGSSMPEIISAGGMMLLCALGSLVAAMLTAVCSSRIAANFSSTLRGKLFAKVESFSMEEIGRFSTASLITRSTNDITQVQMLIVMGLQMLIKPEGPLYGLLLPGKPRSQPSGRSARSPASSGSGRCPRLRRWLCC